jgi:hypothetical protein
VYADSFSEFFFIPLSLRREDQPSTSKSLSQQL